METACQQKEWCAHRLPSRQFSIVLNTKQLLLYSKTLLFGFLFNPQNCISFSFILSLFKINMFINLPRRTGAIWLLRALQVNTHTQTHNSLLLLRQFPFGRLESKPKPHCILDDSVNNKSHANLWNSSTRTCRFQKGYKFLCN